MGNLLKILTCKDDSEEKIDFFVDFENAKPDYTELPVWREVQTVLVKAADYVTSLKNYSSAGMFIKQAMIYPKDEYIQEQAWQAVCQQASQLKQFYLFSIELDVVTRRLLTALTSADLTPRQHLESQQALFKQFAEIIDFTLCFDDVKMSNPAIQNDFSYYRRALSKRSITPEINDDLDVDNELANRMSLFYAEPTPMLKSLRETTTSFVHTHCELPLTNTTDCLSTMAEICRVMIENEDFRRRYANEETLMFCLRVMVGVIILLDHVHPAGAFCKSSGINIKSCIRVIKFWDTAKVEGLLNALRYTTKHLNDVSTPKSIRQQLSVQ